MTAPASCTILFIGTGLINTSLALALGEHASASSKRYHRLGWDTEPQNLTDAQARGALDAPCSSMAAAIAQADVVIVGVPINAYPKVFAALAQYAKPDAVISDVGSVKGKVLQWAAQFMPQHLPRFVPAHPIAGRELSGPLAADGKLFLQQKLILTPHAALLPSALTMMTELWQSVGAETSMMSVEAHDEVCAAISHVPHLLSMALVWDLLPDADASSANDAAPVLDGEMALHYAGGGFRDFSRIAGSHPTMWHDIFLTNPEAILRRLTSLEQCLKKFRHLLTHPAADNPELHETLAKISQRQRKWRAEYGK